MARNLWSGIISFGLVNIPVKMYTAVRKHELRFHQLHKTDQARVKYKIVCSADDKELDRDDIVRGYEISRDRYVIVDDEELDAVQPQASRAIEILKFINLDEIDPIYFDKPYYLLPDKNAEKSYALFVKALEDSRRVGICKFVMRQKEYLAALRAFDGVICTEILHYADEVTMPKELEERPEKTHVNAKELKVAQQLIEALSDEFHPEEFHNEYIERVEELMKQKAKGEDVVLRPPEAKKAKVIDLMEALEQSLKSAKKRTDAADNEDVKEMKIRPAAKRATKKKAAKAPAKKRKTA